MRRRAYGPCTEWPKVNKNGYGTIKVGNRSLYVHRVAYAVIYGELDPALVIDHLCANRACYDGDHLEEITFAENARRGQERRWARERGEPDPFYDPTVVVARVMPLVTPEDIRVGAPQIAARMLAAAA